MKSLVTLLAFCCSTALWAAEPVAPTGRIPLTGPNCNFLVKLTSYINAGTNKPGDVVTGVVIVPAILRGGRVEGTIERADHGILRFSFQRLKFKEYSYDIGSAVTGVVSSKGMAGQDDLGQRVRMDGGGIVAYGTTTAIDEGAEIRFVAWEKENP